MAGTLSGGEQQMLAIGRALMARPGCCCWTSRRWAWRRCWSSRSSTIDRRDQPAGHDDPAGRAERRAWRSAIAHRGYVLETGAIVLPDTAAELSENAEVRRAYLGE